jgi:choline-glycine betaine transporter
MAMLQLPNELLLNIFSHLPLRSVIMVSATCRDMRSHFGTPHGLDSTDAAPAMSLRAWYFEKKRRREAKRTRALVVWLGAVLLCALYAAILFSLILFASVHIQSAILALPMHVFLLLWISGRRKRCDDLWCSFRRRVRRLSALRDELSIALGDRPRRSHHN